MGNGLEDSEFVASGQGLSIVSIPAPYNLEGLTKSPDWRFRVYYERLFYQAEGAVVAFLEQKISEGGGVYSETIDITHDDGFNLMFRMEVRIWVSRDGDLRIEIKNMPVTEEERIDNRLVWATSIMQERAEDGALTQDIELEDLKRFMQVTDGVDEWGAGHNIDDIILLGVVRLLKQRIRASLEEAAVLSLEQNAVGGFLFEGEGGNIGHVADYLWKKDSILMALARRSHQLTHTSGSMVSPDFLTQGVYIPREIPEEAVIFYALPYGDENLVVATSPAREVLAAAGFEPDFDGVDRYEVSVIGVPDPRNGGHLFVWVDKKE